MPNSPSAAKRLRQTETRALRHKRLRSATRTWRKRVQEAIAAGDKAQAEALLPTAYKHLDKCAKKRILHPNTAANYKRSLARKIAAL
jgi:small subunit ribosomal protein S20